MADPRIPSRVDPASQVGPVARLAPVAPSGPAAIATGDRLALTRPQAAKPATFSWRRAMSRFWDGFKAQARDTCQSIAAHPLRTLAGVAVFGGLTFAAGAVGISPVAIANFSLFAFGALASFRLGRAVFEAVGDWRRGEMAEVEADFEAIGRGGFEVALTLGPAAAGKAVSILRRTEAGASLVAVWRESAVGKATAAVTGLPGKAWTFVRENTLGRLKTAAGQEGVIADIASRARTLTQVLGRNARLAAVKGRLDAWRVAIADSGTVRGFNYAFDTVPTRFDGWAITKVNYSDTGRKIRDWGIAHRAKTDPAAARMLELIQKGRVAGAGMNEPITRFAKVGDKLYRGSAPTLPADFERLAREHNVKTIVSLLHPENPKEIGLLLVEKELAAKYGMEFVNIPLPFGVDPPPEMIARFLAAVDNSKGTAYVHCRLGRDRTGAMAAVYELARMGKSNTEAYATMMAFDFDPEKDTYLQYLADFVQGFGRGTLAKVKNFFLIGSAREAGQAVRDVAPALARPRDR